MKQNFHSLLIVCLLSIIFLYTNVVRADNPSIVNFVQGKLTKQGSTVSHNTFSREIGGHRNKKGRKKIEASNTVEDIKRDANDTNPINYFKLAIDHALSVDVSVDYQTKDGTAIAGQDYIASSGTITISAGTTSILIPITIISDTLDEPNETFFLTITNPVGAKFPEGVSEISAQHTIVDSFDTTAPVISITGSTSLNVYQNTAYSDAGATAVDDVDGTLTVSHSGSVNSNVIGTYTITYDAHDSSGNEAAQVTRTVNVIASSSKYPHLPETINNKTALNFLSMTSFGATKESIEALKTKGIETWVNEQLAFTFESNNHFRRTIELSKKIFPSDSPASVDAYIADNDTIFNPEGSSKPTVYQMSAWFQTALFDENQLQHRVAYALSQIIVESLAEPIFSRRGEALATYFDSLSKHSFGNYRDLLIEISHSSSMGLYLTYHGSKKEELVGSSIVYPDENYAREIMQLFTIGLYELNLDGTVKTDASGNTIPTYTQTDVNELAKVFTGWDIKRNSRFGRVAKKDGDYSHPLEFTAEYHDFREKSVLGKSIQAGNDGSNDMIAAIDILMAHPNIAPFISKQLIMRLVKSNPTPAYVARVATVFNDNGQGVKGDLKAVVKAILLDAEVWEVQGVKKFKEPLLAYTEFLRAFHVQNLPTWKLSKQGEEIKNTVYFVDPTRHLGQGASRAYSVFNFYNNDYIPNDTTFKQAGLSAPELQIQTDSIFIGFSNNILDDLKNREKNYLLKKYGTLTDIDVLLTKSNLFYYSGSNKFLLDCKDEYAVMEEAIEGSSDGNFESFNSVGRSDDSTADANGETDRDRALNALIVALDNKLLAGTLGADKKDLLFESYKEWLYNNAIKNSDDPKNKIYEKIILPIILAIVTSENFMVQE